MRLVGKSGHGHNKFSTQILKLPPVLDMPLMFLQAWPQILHYQWLDNQPNSQHHYVYLELWTLPQDVHIIGCLQIKQSSIFNRNFMFL